MIGPFQHLTPTRIVFAPDGLEGLGVALDAAGIRRAVLVCGTTNTRVCYYNPRPVGGPEEFRALYEAAW